MYYLDRKWMLDTCQGKNRDTSCVGLRYIMAFRRAEVFLRVVLLDLDFCCEAGKSSKRCFATWQKRFHYCPMTCPRSSSVQAKVVGLVAAILECRRLAFAAEGSTERRSACQDEREKYGIGSTESVCILCTQMWSVIQLIYAAVMRDSRTELLDDSSDVVVDKSRTS